MKTYQIQILDSDIRSGKEVPFYQLPDQKSATVKINEILNQSCVAYFGVHPSQISGTVISKVMTEFLKNHTDLSIEEFEHCFARMERPKEKIVVISVHDLLDPIKKYKSAKNFVSKETKRLIQEEREAEERKIRESEHLDTAIKIYKESLASGEWSGTIFHAIVLAKEVLKNKLPEDVKEGFFKDAKEQEIDIKKKTDAMPQEALKYFGYTWQRIAAEMYIKECLKRNIVI